MFEIMGSAIFRDLFSSDSSHANKSRQYYLQMRKGLQLSRLDPLANVYEPVRISFKRIQMVLIRISELRLSVPTHMSGNMFRLPETVVRYDWASKDQ